MVRNVSRGIGSATMCGYRSGLRVLYIVTRQFAVATVIAPECAASTPIGHRR
jgi:hypothetical protein